MTLGVPDPIVRKVTGHRSRELERYQHLRALTVNLIATELFRAKRAKKELAHLPAQCAVGMSRKNSGISNIVDPGEMLAGCLGRLSELAHQCRVAKAALPDLPTGERGVSGAIG